MSSKQHETAWTREWTITGINDTRQFDFETRKPVPQSGDARECDHCGRAHEVHVSVSARDGRTAIIGTGCCKNLTFDWSSVSTESLRLAAIAANRTA